MVTEKIVDIDKIDIVEIASGEAVTWNRDMGFCTENEKANIFRIELKQITWREGKEEISVYFKDKDNKTFGTTECGKNGVIEVEPSEGFNMEKAVALKEQYERSINEHERYKALWKLLSWSAPLNNQAGEDEAISILFDIARHPDAAVRTRFARDMRAMDIKAVSVFLPVLLNDSDKAVKLEAQESFMRFALKKMTGGIEHMFESAFVNIGLWARSLQRYLPDASLDEIIKAEPEVRNLILAGPEVKEWYIYTENKDEITRIKFLRESFQHLIERIADILRLIEQRLCELKPRIERANNGAQQNFRILSEEHQKAAEIIRTMQETTYGINVTPTYEIIAKLVEEVVSRVKNVEIKVTKQPDIVWEALEVKADTAFKDILFHIISHCVKFEANVMRIELTQENEMVKISLRDNGRGIPHGKLAYVGLPFYSSLPGGRSLTLYRAKMIISRCGGGIAAANNPEGGAQFTIMLPTREHEEFRDLMHNLRNPFITMDGWVKYIRRMYAVHIEERMEQFFAIVETLSTMIEQDRIKPLSKEEVKEILNSNITSFISAFSAFKEVAADSFPDMLLKHLVSKVFPEEYKKALSVIAQLRFWVPYSMSRVCIFAIMWKKIEALKMKYPAVNFELRVPNSFKKVVAIPVDVFDITFDEYVLNVIKYSGTNK